MSGGTVTEHSTRVYSKRANVQWDVVVLTPPDAPIRLKERRRAPVEVRARRVLRTAGGNNATPQTWGRGAHRLRSGPGMYGHVRLLFWKKRRRVHRDDSSCPRSGH